MGRFRGGRRLALVPLALLCVIWLAGCGPLPDSAALQDRLAVPAERPSLDTSLGQTIVAGEPRLAAVEVRLAVYGEGGGHADGDLVLTLHEDDPQGSVVASTRHPISSLAHNSYFRLAFPPLPESRGRRYYLGLASTTPGPSRATAWATIDDSYPPGSMLVDGRPHQGDLAFRAYYDLDLARLAVDLAVGLRRHGWAVFVGLALLLLPGILLGRVLGLGRDLDYAERIGLWLGLSVALAPLGLGMITLVGGLFSAMAVGGLLLLASNPTGLRFHPSSQDEGDAADEIGPRRLGSGVRRAAKLWAGLWSPATVAFITAAVAGVLRFIHAKDLALPMWVDSVHHTLIAELIVTGGRVPVDYGPLMPAQPFTYHFGFHSLVAYLRWLTGIDAAAGVLLAGQLLNALVVFPVYLLGARLSGDRRVGMLAALTVGLISTMPAYYVSWGRYPQLAGLMVLPAAYVLCQQAWTRRPSGRLMVLAGMTLAGQVLAHPRVALLLAGLLLASIVWEVATRRKSPSSLLGPLGCHLGAGGVAVLLLLPWLQRLSGSVVAGLVGTPAPMEIHEFPWESFTAGADRSLLAIAAAGVVVGLIARRREAVVVAIWVALALLMANPYLVGAPISLMLSNEALAIALFLPIAVLLGSLGSLLLDVVGYAVRPHWVRRALAVPLLVVGAWGANGLVGIVNPSCLLATADDVEAIDWVREHTPPDSLFLINSRPWRGEVHAGTDAGYWLPALAGRRTTLPPLGYDHAAREEVERINRLAAWTQSEVARAPDDSRSVLVEEGVSHVFIGSRGGPLHYDTLLEAGGYRLLYTNGRAWVFEVLGGDASGDAGRSASFGAEAAGSD